MSQLRQSKIERLQKRRDQIAARIQAMQNRLARIESRKDTRRKIIIGRFFQHKHLREGTSSHLLSLLDPFLVRPYDRRIFGLDADQSAIDISQLPLRGIILLGAYYLEKYTPEDKQAALLAKIDPFVIRPVDRKLFGLPIVAP